MRKAFSDERFLNEKWDISKKFNDVPVYYVKPITKSNKAVVFIPGLNGNGVLIKYFNYDFLGNFNLFSFDQRAQGDNKNTASRRYNQYLKDLDEFIQEIKIRYPHINEFYLIGESWGSTISFLYSKKYPNKVNGVMGWNMPYNVVDVSEVKGWEKTKNSLKTVLTFLTNINTYDKSPMAEALTNNKILKRIVKTIKNQKLSNRVIIASWLSFKKGWKYLIKNSKKVNCCYVQSLEDAMITKSIVEKNKDKITILEKGYHILTFDDDQSSKLFEIMEKFLNKNN